MTTSEMATVLAWHDALNAGDVDTLLSLSSAASVTLRQPVGGRGQLMLAYAPN